MHPPGRKGGAVPDEDAFGDEAKTDPHISRRTLDGEDPPTLHDPSPSDPVLAALAELDGNSAVEQARSRQKLGGRSAAVAHGFEGPVEPTVRTEMPLFADEPDTPSPAGAWSPMPPASSTPARKLRLPMPGEANRAGASTLVDEEPPSEIASPRQSVQPPRTSGESPSFSGAELIEKLAEPAEEKKRSGSFFRDYREAILTGVLGIAVLGGVIAYRKLAAQSPTEVRAIVFDGAQKGGATPSGQPRRDRAQPPAAAGPAAPVGAPATVNAIETKEPATLQGRPSNVFQRARVGGSEVVPYGGTQAPANQPQAPSSPSSGSGEVAPQMGEIARAGNAAKSAEPAPTQRAKTPMLTVLSTPKGALVELDGVVLGNTPLVMPIAAGRDRIRITVMLDGYRKWENLVDANAAGHFSVNVTLKPAK